MRTTVLGQQITTPQTPGVARDSARARALATGVAAIEALRGAEEPASERWTIEQMRALVQGLATSSDPNALAEATGWDVTTVLDVIGDFGTRIRKKVGGAQVLTITADEAGMLFDIVGDTEKLRKRAKRAKGAIDDEALFSSPVVLPRGFERGSENRRDVRKAIAAIIGASRRGLMSDALLSGYLDRKQPVRVIDLGFAHVSAVWKFASEDRLHEITQVSTDHAFGQVLVQAYDLLEVARLDALAGIAELVSGEVEIPAILRACARARWIATSEINRIEETAKRVQERPSAHAALVRELAFFAQRVRVTPGYLPVSVADLNEGQVLRIAELAGLPTEIDRNEERLVRKGLVELGFTADLDQLIPQGVRCTQAGLGDAFWDAMQARANKDPLWQNALQEALDAHEEPQRQN